MDECYKESTFLQILFGLKHLIAAHYGGRLDNYLKENEGKRIMLRWPCTRHIVICHIDRIPFKIKSRDWYYENCK